MKVCITQDCILLLLVSHWCTRSFKATIGPIPIKASNVSTRHNTAEEKKQTISRTGINTHTHTRTHTITMVELCIYTHTQ